MLTTTGTRVLADLREIVREQIAYRELLVRMTHRDLLLSGPQTVMGFGWASAAVSVVALVAAWVVFDRAEFTFVENI